MAPAERHDFETRTNKTISQKISEITQQNEQQEVILRAKANESIDDLSQTAWKRSTNLDVEIALLKRDAGKVEYLVKLSQELKQKVVSMKKALQTLGRRFNGEEIEEDSLQLMPALNDL